MRHLSDTIISSPPRLFFLSLTRSLLYINLNKLRIFGQTHSKMMNKHTGVGTPSR